MKRAFLASTPPSFQHDGNQKRAHISPPTLIDSLPNHLIASVIQRLTWRDRIRVESVNRRWRSLALAHGWTQIKSISTKHHTAEGFDDYGGAEEMARRISRLLDRCGDRLESVHLHGINDVDCVIELLRKCPNAVDIRFEAMPEEERIFYYLSERNDGEKRYKAPM